MKQRLTNDNLSRALHQTLYQRMVSFCQQYTPEFPAEPVVESWLSRLYKGDDNLHILASFDSSWQLVGHAVIDVQDHYGYKVVYCHQAHADKGYQSTLEEGIEYVEKLRSYVGAYCSCFSVTKHIKGLEKKYGYQVVRTMMMKYESQQNEDN